MGYTSPDESKNPFELNLFIGSHPASSDQSTNDMQISIIMFVKYGEVIFIVL